MTREPQRWLDDPAALDPEIAEAARAFQHDAPNQAQLDRMLHGLAVPELGGSPKLASNAILSTTWKWVGISSLALLATLGALLGGSKPRPETSRDTPPSAVPTTQATSSPRTGPTQPDPVETVTPAAAEPAPTARKTPAQRSTRTPEGAARAARFTPSLPGEAAPTAPDNGDPRAELGLLQRARRVLPGAPARALELAEEHRASFIRGVFAEERELLAIEALLALGRRRAAETRAAEFERLFPRSVHAQRLHTLMAREEKSEDPPATQHSLQQKETTPQP